MDVENKVCELLYKTLNKMDKIEWKNIRDRLDV